MELTLLRNKSVMYSATSKSNGKCRIPAPYTCSASSNRAGCSGNLLSAAALVTKQIDGLNCSAASGLHDAICAVIMKG